MKKSYRIATYLLIALGIIHISVAAPFFKELSMEIMWFVSAGLGLIWLGFLNIAFWRSGAKDRISAILCMAGNALAVTFVVVVSFVNREPGNYVVVAVIISVMIASFLVARQANSEGLPEA